MTDIYDDLYALLDADDWSSYGSQPPIYDSNIDDTGAISEDHLMIFPEDEELEITATHEIIYRVKKATILIKATTKANRDKLQADVIAALGSSAVFMISDTPTNYPDYYARSIEVGEIA